MDLYEQAVKQCEELVSSDKKIDVLLPAQAVMVILAGLRELCDVSNIPCDLHDEAMNLMKFLHAELCPPGTPLDIAFHAKNDDHMRKRTTRLESN